MKRCSVSLPQMWFLTLLDLQTSESCITQYAYRDVQGGPQHMAGPALREEHSKAGVVFTGDITKLHNNVSSDPATPLVGIFSEDIPPQR